MNPRILEKYIEAHAKKRELDLKILDQANHMLGRYISFAHHDPKNYPKEPAFNNVGKPKSKTMTPDEMEKRMRWNTLAMRGNINGNNS